MMRVGAFAPALAEARLYQGQTMNLRTPGGGFSPVLEVRALTDLSVEFVRNGTNPLLPRWKRGVQGWNQCCK
jgi:hypothetical protein